MIRFRGFTGALHSETWDRNKIFMADIFINLVKKVTKQKGRKTCTEHLGGLQNEITYQ